jgi:hypothetical protein
MRILPFFLLILSASVSFAQSINQAAVDTLTKEVALAVFATINQPKAQEIYAQLVDCGDGCEAQEIIRSVGSWDQVGQRIQQLSQLRDTKAFIGMGPAEANAAIRRQLAQFYQRNKAYESYRKALPPNVQLQILAKIDRMLPPAEMVEPAPTVSGNPDAATTEPVVTGDEATIDPATFQLGQLEREVKETKEKQLWMMIISGIVGLVIGAGAIYLLLYRGTEANAKALLKENNQLRNSLETAQRTKPGNEAATNAVRPEYRQKVSAYDAIVAELGSDNPLTAIRQLKQKVSGNAPRPAPAMRSGEVRTEPVEKPEPVQALPPVAVTPVAEPAPAPLATAAKPAVFYCPPPDPNGQFDLSQKSEVISPESAYRFSIGADKPTVASFRFEADPNRLARFLTYRNYMIEPACDSENTYTTTHTRVAMRKDGEAVLENGTWRVKTKALIRYE